VADQKNSARESSRQSRKIRRLGVGDEAVAVRFVEDIKFVDDEITGVTVAPDYFKDFLADDRHYFLAGWVGEEPAGYVFAYRLARFDGGRPEIFFYEVDVAKPHRRQGLGRALLEELKRLARADGCGKMYVPTSRSNTAAMALYQAAGGEEGEPDAAMLWWDWRSESR
jgi:GNAT superfamily N-acetyltransferase